MASDFEIYVNTELPKRISSLDDPLTIPEGSIPVFTGIGLITSYKTAEELVLYGKSAYQLAVDNGYEGTIEEWLVSLKGEDGENGQSAYELAVSLGFVGDEADFILSLKGEKGAEGTRGPIGPGVMILANITEEEFKEIVDADDSKVGDGYIVDEFIYIFRSSKSRSR